MLPQEPPRTARAAVLLPSAQRCSAPAYGDANSEEVHSNTFPNTSCNPYAFAGKLPTGTVCFRYTPVLEPQPL
ncbi:hypothetical protein ThimaDRAFT_4444 [Thiocapsa marina 5811]|uniref:Uncharacterized protein n=1 Tax=Thiocapsa marina 5811 TaxID=768671 RepID=F9UHP1_9GAMM|nr:hypothetical protein ThimaDRAFT_4444 [Thiocapsa marina 5811]